MKIPFDAVKKLESDQLMFECLHVRKFNDPRKPDGRTDSGQSVTLLTISELDKPQYELYIPAPRDIGRDEAYAFHLSTRNFFAYAVGGPVVGERLSSALEGLWQRLRSWAPKAATAADMTTYLETQGYSNFAENSEHALACLKFAETARLREVWVDAFVHCSGMHERLFMSPEFAGLSNTTNALVTRAALEMDLHIARVTRAVGSFLEEEFGAEHLGLTKPARDHLDYFRTFLHAFYVDKLGYFPPQETSPWDKRPWKAMYQDFQTLYDYLVDSESTSDMSDAKALTGGICVIQNLQAFDQRHGYEALPHPLPLLPQQPETQGRKTSHKGLRSLALVHGGKIPERKFSAQQGLAMATNCLNDNVNSCQLVQEYQRFERHKLSSKLDLSEARKVRWLLIYGVLQMLASIMRAPKEVRGVEDASYPLCVLTGGCPPWTQNEKFRTEDFEAQNLSNKALVPDAMEALEGRTSRISIHPDCEADNAEDFFAANSPQRTDTQNSSVLSSPQRLSRTGSIRNSMHSSVQALHRSVVGSLSKRNSIRHEMKSTPSQCEILVEDYSMGAYDDWRPATAFQEDNVEEDPAAETSNGFQEFDFGLDTAVGEPTLEDEQLEDEHYGMATSEKSDFSRRESYLTTSTRSSYQEYDSPDTDISSWESGSYEEDEEEDSSPSSPVDPRQSFDYLEHIRSKIRTKPVSVNVGCYVPSGMKPPKQVKFASHARSFSIQSNASSLYPDQSNQAWDIEEAERGRRRSRTYETDVSVYAE